jgi:hypothetical protein
MEGFMFKRTVSVFVLFTFLLSSLGVNGAYAQALGLPQPGQMVGLTPAFTPAHLKGMVIHPNEPFKFDFIIHHGDTSLDQAGKQAEYQKLIKYFLAALAVPDNEQWVNLSPYEKDRIIPDTFGKTEMGRDLLSQDYILKQISASLTNPDTELGKKFWDEVYARAHEKLGTTDIPTDTFNKVWIQPDKAVIYEKDNTVYVVDQHLKVMIESDYLAESKEHRAGSKEQKENSNNSNNPSMLSAPGSMLASQVLKDIIIPVIEKEVNEGKNFAQLRQVYSGMLLAAWYKRALKESILTKVYGNQNKVKGIDQDPKNNQAIYDQYVQAFKAGVFNMIKEDVDRYTNEVVPRKYFSGGFSLEGLQFDQAQAVAGQGERVDAAMMDVVSAEVQSADAAQRRNNPVQTITRGNIGVLTPAVVVKRLRQIAETSARVAFTNEFGSGLQVPANVLRPQINGKHTQQVIDAVQRGNIIELSAKYGFRKGSGRSFSQRAAEVTIVEVSKPVGAGKADGRKDSDAAMQTAASGEIKQTDRKVIVVGQTPLAAAEVSELLRTMLETLRAKRTYITGQTIVLSGPRGSHVERVVSAIVRSRELGFKAAQEPFLTHDNTWVVGSPQVSVLIQQIEEAQERVEQMAQASPVRTVELGGVQFAPGEVLSVLEEMQRELLSPTPLTGAPTETDIFLLRQGRAKGLELPTARQEVAGRLLDLTSFPVKWESGLGDVSIPRGQEKALLPWLETTIAEIRPMTVADAAMMHKPSSEPPWVDRPGRTVRYSYMDALDRTALGLILPRQLPAHPYLVRVTDADTTTPLFQPMEAPDAPEVGLDDYRRDQIVQIINLLRTQKLALLVAPSGFGKRELFRSQLERAVESAMPEKAIWRDIGGYENSGHFTDDHPLLSVTGTSIFVLDQYITDNPVHRQILEYLQKQGAAVLLIAAGNRANRVKVDDFLGAGISGLTRDNIVQMSIKPFNARQIGEFARLWKLWSNDLPAQARHIEALARLAGEIPFSPTLLMSLGSDSEDMRQAATNALSRNAAYVGYDSLRSLRASLRATGEDRTADAAMTDPRLQSTVTVRPTDVKDLDDRPLRVFLLRLVAQSAQKAIVEEFGENLPEELRLELPVVSPAIMEKVREFALAGRGVAIAASYGIPKNSFGYEARRPMLEIVPVIGETISLADLKAMASAGSTLELGMKRQGTSSIFRLQYARQRFTLTVSTTGGQPVLAVNLVRDSDGENLYAADIQMSRLGKHRGALEILNQMIRELEERAIEPARPEESARAQVPGPVSMTAMDKVELASEFNGSWEGVAAVQVFYASGRSASVRLSYRDRNFPKTFEDFKKQEKKAVRKIIITPKGGENRTFEGDAAMASTVPLPLMMDPIRRTAVDKMEMVRGMVASWDQIIGVQIFYNDGHAVVKLANRDADFPKTFAAFKALAAEGVQKVIITPRNAENRTYESDAAQTVEEFTLAEMGAGRFAALDVPEGQYRPFMAGTLMLANLGTDARQLRGYTGPILQYSRTGERIPVSQAEMAVLLTKPGNALYVVTKDKEPVLVVVRTADAAQTAMEKVLADDELQRVWPQIVTIQVFFTEGSNRNLMAGSVDFPKTAGELQSMVGNDLSRVEFIMSGRQNPNRVYSTDAAMLEIKDPSTWAKPREIGARIKGLGIPVSETEIPVYFYADYSHTIAGNFSNEHGNIGEMIESALRAQGAFGQGEAGRVFSVRYSPGKPEEKKGIYIVLLGERRFLNLSQYVTANEIIKELGPRVEERKRVLINLKLSDGRQLEGLVTAVNDESVGVWNEEGNNTILWSDVEFTRYVGERIVPAVSLADYKVYTETFEPKDILELAKYDIGHSSDSAMTLSPAELSPLVAAMIVQLRRRSHFDATRTTVLIGDIAEGKNDGLREFFNSSELGLPEAARPENNGRGWSVADAQINVLLGVLTRYQATHVAPDAAMAEDFTRGGIDLNASSLDMQIRRDGNGVPLPVAQQDLESIKIDGLVPVILDIRPATTLPMFK